MEKYRFSDCVFFKGEQECPADVDAVPYGYVIWNGERFWCTYKGDLKNEVCSIAAALGLGDEQMKKDGRSADLLKIPFSLRAFLFSAFRHYSDNTPEQDAVFFLDVVLPKYAYYAGFTRMNM